MKDHNYGVENYADAERPNGRGSLSTARNDKGRMFAHPTLWSSYQNTASQAYQIAETCTISTRGHQAQIDSRLLSRPVYAAFRKCVLSPVPRTGGSMMPVHISIVMREVMRILIERAETQMRRAA